MPKTVYLDYAATAPLLPEARTAMLAVLDGEYGNASSLHSPGHAAHKIVETAREQVAQLIGAHPSEIIFTSGSSEANNTVMETFRGQKIAVSSIEHPSVLEAAQARAQQVDLLPVDEVGCVQVEDIPNDVGLVSVMLANNELGTIEPIAEIVERCRKNGTFVHSDATQALGKVHIDVSELGVDYLTISAHKIGGPIGVGALYVRQGALFESLIKGGRQENRRRAGTTNTAAIAGFGAAAQWCWDDWSCKKWRTVAELRNLLCQRILAEVPYSSCNGFAECIYDQNGLPNTLPNILNMSFQAAEGESIQLYLDAAGISVSTGSACAAGDLQPSHVLMATRGDAEVAHSSVRFSLGLETTRDDIGQVMTVLPGIIKRLQGISTVQIKEQL